MKNMLYWRGIGYMVSIALAFLIVLSSCGEEEVDEIRIGGIFDITGGTGDVGAPYADGAKAYFEYVNDNGGINDREVKLYDIDYAYEVPQAIEAYTRLTKQDNVIGILGWGTGDTEAMKELIAEDEIPYISGSYSENLTHVEEHPYNFLSAATYSDQAKVAISWFVENWEEDRTPKMGFMYNDTPFGRSPVHDAIEYAEQIGVEVVDQQVVDITSLDASSQVLNMREHEPDFVLIQQTWGATSTILNDADRLGLDTQFIGLNWAAGEGVIPLADSSAEGYVGVIPHAFPFEDLEGLADVEAYLEGIGNSLEDVDQKFVQGWHSAKVMLEGARLAGDNLTGAGLREGLEQLDQFDTGGLGAPVTFTPEDHRGTSEVRLAEVVDGEWQIITDYIGYE